MIMGSHYSKLHKSTALKWQDTRISKLFDGLNYCAAIVVRVDLDYCVAIVVRVGSFLNTCTEASEWFTSNFSIISLHTGCLSALIESITTSETFT